MRIKGLSNMVNTELSFILPRTLILDGIIFLISLPFYHLCIEIPLGLAVGSVVMLINFVLLGFSSERAVERPLSSAKRYMSLFYFIRLTIMGLLFYLCIMSPYINLMAAAIPQFYPKVFYTVSAAVKKRKGGKGL